MVALEQLRLVASTCARNRQISNLSYRRFQMACVMAIALITTLLGTLIRLRPDTCRSLLLSHTDEGHTHGVPQSVFHQLFKSFLTAHSRFAMLLFVSHWYPPGNLDGELVASSGYQTLLLHTTQDTARELCCFLCGLHLPLHEW